MSSPTSAPTSLPGPHNLTTATLGNGLRVLVYENWDSQTVVLDGYAPGGVWAERPEQAGLANLTASMLRRGAAGRDFDQINEQVEAVGASFSFSAGRHMLSFEGKALAEDVELIFTLIAEGLSQPAFDPKQLEQIRAGILTNVQERDNNPRATAHRLFREHLYPPDHPYHRSLSGYRDTVSALTRADILDYYQKAFTPQRGVVVVAGAIAADEAIAKLEATLGAWQNPEATVPLETPAPPSLPEDRVEARKTIAGKSQSDIVIGWPGIDRRHPDFFPLLVCNSILGRFGLGGRLGNNVREQQGLAYYAYSSFHADLGVGSWYAAAGVNPANVSRAVATILEEIERIRTEPVSPEELADVNANLTGSLPLRLETNGGIAGNLLTIVWHDLGLDYLMRHQEYVQAVSRADVLRVAQTYLHPDRYVLAIAGPQI